MGGSGTPAVCSGPTGRGLPEPLGSRGDGGCLDPCHLMALGSAPDLCGQCPWTFYMFIFEFLREASLCNQSWPQTNSNPTASAPLSAGVTGLFCTWLCWVFLKAS